ncbi:hypothetical protein TPSD3_03430 [Thioflexithrix psekupsensis]|uniref:IrrE N-terminal-like domain-containing protein n=2 Tax=Thioflexithrix psekupsensis TaxID=1570016 RepID=A0A251XCX3_9GAMM|nr:hypothetical protein TPSD3_03430 [Thioflexithrix psekupsensis]
MAMRLLRRRNLQPPFDLDALVADYASVEYLRFPHALSADGITIGIGGKSKPQILINSSTPKTRRKFTLAHELGHIIIPWHTGTIISHTDCVNTNFEYFEYREMELEANQFAAELLMPRDWIQKLNKECNSLAFLIRMVLNYTGVSRDAALIQIFKTINTPIVCAWVGDNGELKQNYRTRTAPQTDSLCGKNLFESKSFVTATSEETFSLGDRIYKSWIFGKIEIIEVEPSAWRNILAQILNETGKQELLSSINAILPAKYSSNKDKSEQELCSLIMRAYDGRSKYDEIISHPLFPQYVMKRVKELRKKEKSNNT